MKLLLLFLSLFLGGLGYGQTDNRPLSVALLSKGGVLLAHRETMSHLVQGRNFGFELEITKQDNSGDIWSRLYEFPSRGFSCQYFDYGNRPVLGQSVSFFRFTKLPLYQSEKWGFLDFRIGNGLSYITKKYDKSQNTKNIAIGSFINGFVNFQLSWLKQFERFHLGAGLDFSHISNASIKMPNQGLNTATFFVNVGFNERKREVFTGDPLPKAGEFVRAENKWHFHFITGIKQNLPGFLPSRNFGIASLQGLYRLNLGYKWDAEFGAELIYNEANRWFYDIQPVPVSQGFQLGAYSGLAMTIYRTQIYFGLGVYALNPVNPAGWVYNRIGARFLMNEKWNLLMGIKAHVGIADYLEWGLGYRF